MVGTN